MGGSIHRLKRSLAEDLHAWIVANRHWAVGFVELIISPSSEGFEVIEGEIERVLGQFWASLGISEEILPEEEFALEADLFVGVEVEVEGESAQVGAGGLETTDEVRNAQPEFVDFGRFELPSHSVGLQLRRQTALQIGRRQDKIGLGTSFTQFLKIYGHLPLLLSFFKGRQDESFFKVSAIPEALNDICSYGCHIPEVGDACHGHGQKEREEDFGIQLWHEININFHKVGWDQYL